MTPALVGPLLAGLLLGLVSVPAGPALQYTVKLEVRRAATPADVSPLLAMMGAQVLEAVAPGGAVELTYVVGKDVVIVRWNKALPGIPAGVALLQRADGVRVMVDAATKTFWRVTVPDLYALGADRRPVITKTLISDSEGLAGVPAVRSAVEIAIPFPEAKAGLLVSGTPTELPLSGEIWVTDRLPRYSTQQVRRVLGLPILGLDVAPVGSFVLRQVLRGPLFGQFELDATVTSLAEVEVPDDLFVVPADFKEVPAPRAGG